MTRIRYPRRRLFSSVRAGVVAHAFESTQMRAGVELI